MKHQFCIAGFYKKSLLFISSLAVLAALFFVVTPPTFGKEFTDDLTTDFYGGKEDNILIRQNLKGSLQLAPYAILGNWNAVNAPSSTSLYLASTTVYNGKLYLSGGFGSTDSAGINNSGTDNAINRIWYATVLADGKIEEWKEVDETSRLPQPTYGHSSAAVNGRLYIIGGSNSIDKTPVSSVYWAKIIGYDGSIKAYYKSNTWTAVASLPTPLFKGAAAQYEGRIYVAGGIDLSNVAQNCVYYADVKPDGDITSWQTASAQLPGNLAGHAMAQSNGHLYVVGGSTTGEQINATSSVYIGTIDPNTGDVVNWTTGTNLPEALFGAATTISAGKIWVSGGIVSGTARAKVYFARIDRLTGLIPGPGQPDTWTRTTDLPIPVYNHNMVSFNGHLYITGGYNAGASDKFYTSTLLTNKTNIKKWVPTTPLFKSPYGDGSLKTWTGHTAILRVPLKDSASLSSGAPMVYVIGGGGNTYNAYADGQTFDGIRPDAYTTIYNSEIDSNGQLKTWMAPDTSGVIPIASIMHMSTLSNGGMFVIGGANSVNATIWADAPACSISAAGYMPPSGTKEMAYGEPFVFYEQVQQGGGSNGGAGTFEKTAPIPIFDPAYEYDTYQTVRGVYQGPSDPQPGANVATSEPIYQPLIRAAVTSYNGIIYVIGGISRENDAWAGNDPLSSRRYFEKRIWYCRPNPAGSINEYGGPGGWKTIPDNDLSSTVLAPDLKTRYDAQACVAYGRVYLFGGRDDSGKVCSEVFYARIKDDGTLDKWVEDTPMPITLAEHQVVFTSGRFYVIGGVTDAAGNLTDNVFYCTPAAQVAPYTPSIPTGANPGAWELSLTSLEYPVAGHQCVSNNGFIYVLGGRYNLTDPHTSSAYLINIADMYHTQNLVYAWAGNYERYVDLDKDQLVQFINWDAVPNNQTIQFRYRYALEKGQWSPWTLSQTLGPVNVNHFCRYIHYKIHFETLINDLASGADTPELSRVVVDYAASKRVNEDNFQINHNKFDPQVQTLTISYKTRDHSVDGVVLRIYNLEGEMIKKQEFPIQPGTALPVTGAWIWNGTNDNDELVANGVYIVQYNSGDTHKIRKVVVYKQ